MDLDTVRKAIDSLEGFPGRIGLMGGEPAVHPQFAEICKIYQEMIPDKRKRELWTSGYRWNDYKDVILETFDTDRISYNDHTQFDGKHQPLLVAAKDVIDNEELMWELIDECWVQKQWSASITPKGAFFCEVAAAQAHLYNSFEGYPIEKGWWRKTPAEFQDQVKLACPNCSGAIPMPKVSDGRGGKDGATVDWISKSIAEKLQLAKSPKYIQGQVKMIDVKFTREDIEKYGRDWNPSHYRSFVAHTPDDVAKKNLHHNHALPGT
jgi:hypothetical protein